MTYAISDSHVIYMSLTALQRAVTRRYQSETLGDATPCRLKIVPPTKAECGLVLVDPQGRPIANAEGRRRIYTGSIGANTAKRYIGGKIRGARLLPLLKHEARAVRR